jgi:branched-chain amino acid transport system substrate-binding protein
MQEAYPFTVKAKGTYKEKWDFLKFGEAVPAPSQSLESLAPTKAESTCKM